MGVNGILDGPNKLLKFKYIILSSITIKINAMLIGLINVLHRLRLEKRIASNTPIINNLENFRLLNW